MEQLKTKIRAEDYKEPQIQQEIQFIEAASLLEAQEISIEEAQERYFQALSCTFSLEWLSQKELPFIKREEGIIISNIANLYRKIGKQEEAQEIFKRLYEVYEQQQRFLKINFPACVVALGQYSGLLGDRKEYAYALEIDFYLMSVGELLYNQA